MCSVFLLLALVGVVACGTMLKDDLKNMIKEFLDINKD